MKYLSLVVLMFLIFFFPCRAATQESEESGIVMPIQKGEKAPFDGILLDIEASAKVLADSEAELEKEKINCDYKLDVANAESALTVSSLQISLDYERKNHVQTISMYDEQIANLEQLATQIPEDDDDWIWVLVGASCGVAITSVTFGMIMGLK